jgi:hypothetical protein
LVQKRRGVFFSVQKRRRRFHVDMSSSQLLVLQYQACKYLGGLTNRQITGFLGIRYNCTHIHI